MAAYPDSPHFPFPFGRDANGNIPAVEQDSVEEIMACEMLIAYTPLGSRQERPEFGWAQPDMELAPVDLTPLVTALNQFEPRADASLENTQAIADAAMGQANITVDIGIPVGTDTAGVSEEDDS